MKKFIFLLMISSVLIIQCSNESETYQRDTESTEEAIDLDEAVKTGYEACKVCNPDIIVDNQ